jgi:hypothetical protein
LRRGFPRAFLRQRGGRAQGAGAAKNEQMNLNSSVELK